MDFDKFANYSCLWISLCIQLTFTEWIHVPGKEAEARVPELTYIADSLVRVCMTWLQGPPRA